MRQCLRAQVQVQRDGGAQAAITGQGCLCAEQCVFVGPLHLQVRPSAVHLDDDDCSPRTLASTHPAPATTHLQGAAAANTTHTESS